MSFVQLQVISTNSLMKSTLKIDDLIHQAVNKGYKALALTDHNVLFGAIEFYEKAITHGIKPIIGLTLDVSGYILKEEIFPLVLIAKNFTGYQQLIKLSTKYQLSDKKSVNITDVIKNSSELIVISPSINGEISTLVNNGSLEDVNRLSEYLTENIQDFYLGVSIQQMTNNLLDFYKNTKYSTVALGNIQYLTTEDALPSRVLQVLSSDTKLIGEEQPKINEFLSSGIGDFSLKNPKEMRESYRQIELEDLADKTIELANQINIEIELGRYIMPKYKTGNHERSTDYLQKLCEDRLNKRIENVTEEYEKRLAEELNVISSMGFSDYFLIVWDIMAYAHEQNIYTGSGRGSAAGSLVAYLLKITNVDPIEYNLLFERFLNKNRFTMPDIDLDFPDNKREQILQYIFQKYGAEKVAQIGTIGTYGAKSAIRDVARVFGASQNEIKQWAKILPSRPQLTLEEAMKEKNVQKLVNSNEQNRRIFNIAKKIEGCNRHVSTHAAGVVISDHPLTELTPLQKGNNNIYLTQYTMDDVENVGLLKLDILGLRNLSVLADCIRFIPYENNGKSIDIDNIPLDDEKTLEIFRNGTTDGVFQFESPGIRRVLKKLKPSSFEDVVAVNALYRPGPMQQIDTFINRKNGSEPVRYPHNDLKDILEITYGIMVYQEQVMQVASKMAGYTLNEADILRRAISQKDIDAIEEGRKDFINGSSHNGYEHEVAAEVYNYIEKFADYGFNRSHAVAYSKVAYQLAYVKANYPASFFAAILQGASRNKMQEFITEAKQANVKFLSPNVNKSYYSFIIEGQKIRFGLEIIKGVPRDFIKEIIKERRTKGEYKDLIDFLSRIDERWLNKDQLLPFIYSGAFDELEDTRNSMIFSSESIIDSIKMSHGNVELFDIFSPTIIKKDEISDEDKMEQEFETTGFYFTMEPGEKYNQLRNNSKILYLNQVSSGNYAHVLVVVKKIKHIQTKNGKPMSFVDVVDSTGKGNLTLFPTTHLRYIKKINVGDTILVEGKVESKEYPTKIIANKITNAEQLINERKEGNPSETQKYILYIRFQSIRKESRKLGALQKLLKEFHGNSPVIIYDLETKQQKPFKREFYANVNQNLINRLEKMFKSENIAIKKINNQEDKDFI